jgi:hypothetical protein
MVLDQRAEPQHDPSRGLRLLTQVRDMACDGPGCPRAAAQCDLDHEQDYALGGVTAPWNLRHRSPRCHHRKHSDWTVSHDHLTGTSTWTSPAGSSYERLGFWPAPAPLPADAVLPPPRLEPPLTLAKHSHNDAEIPLWHEPLPPGSRHGRVTELKDVRDPDAKPGPLARRIAAFSAHLAAAGTASDGSWDDGPPPF